MPTIVPRNQRVNLDFNQVKVKIRYSNKTLHKEFYTKGATHQKTFKFMNAIKSSNVIIGGFHNPTNPHHDLKCKPKINLENKKLPSSPHLDKA